MLRPVSTPALGVEQAKDGPLSAAAVDICVQADLANLADAGSTDGSAGEEWWRFSCALLAPFLRPSSIGAQHHFFGCLSVVCCIAVTVACQQPAVDQSLHLQMLWLLAMEPPVLWQTFRANDVVLSQSGPQLLCLG